METKTKETKGGFRLSCSNNYVHCQNLTERVIKSISQAWKLKKLRTTDVEISMSLLHHALTEGPHLFPHLLSWWPGLFLPVRHKTWNILRKHYWASTLPHQVVSHFHSVPLTIFHPWEASIVQFAKSCPLPRSQVLYIVRLQYGDPTTKLGTRSTNCSLTNKTPLTCHHHHFLCQLGTFSSGILYTHICS